MSWWKWCSALATVSPASSSWVSRSSAPVCRRRQPVVGLAHLGEDLPGAQPPGHDVETVAGELGLELFIVGTGEPDKSQPRVQVDVGGEPVELVTVGAGTFVVGFADPRPRRLVRSVTGSL